MGHSAWSQQGKGWNHARTGGMCSAHHLACNAYCEASTMCKELCMQGHEGWCQGMLTQYLQLHNKRTTCKHQGHATWNSAITTTAPALKQTKPPQKQLLNSLCILSIIWLFSAVHVRGQCSRVKSNQACSTGGFYLVEQTIHSAVPFCIGRHEETQQPLWGKSCGESLSRMWHS
jgi:hypothetical protein